MIYKNATSFFLLIIIFSTSCSVSKTPQTISFPGINIPSNEMNTSVQLWDDPLSANTYKEGDVLILRIRNISKENFTLQNYSEVKIFVKQGDRWKVLQNTMGYPGGEVNLAPQSMYPPGDEIVIIPEIMELKEPVTMYIVITGHYAEEPDKVVGAYIGIKMNP